MAEEKLNKSPEAGLHIASSPHLSNQSLSTKRIMTDVVIALVPAIAVAVYLFGFDAIRVIGLSVLTCLLTEAAAGKLRKRPATLGDASAVLTGIILALSLPWSTPWYIVVIAGFMAIGLGKAAFGGLGMNLFNPAMVGRAFVMLSFAKEMGAGAYVKASSTMAVVTQATPLTEAKQLGETLGLDQAWPMFMGNVNGSLGETSALAILIGGVFLCLRRSASWEIPGGVILATIVLGGISQLLGHNVTILGHILGGAFLFGAFFIATDPVSSPITPKGKFIFGLGVGILIILIRVFSGYPEGVMFAVLLMNAATPLINRWTIPTPVGGPFTR